MYVCNCENLALNVILLQSEHNCIYSEQECSIEDDTTRGATKSIIYLFTSNCPGFLLVRKPCVNVDWHYTMICLNPKPNYLRKGNLVKFNYTNAWGNKKNITTTLLMGSGSVLVSHNTSDTFHTKEKKMIIIIN